jgi:hypothetical protein
VAKLGCLLVIALIWAGGQGVYEAVRNRAPRVVSCSEAQTALPSEQWLHLTGCRVNVLGAAYKSRGNTPTGDIYIPITAAGGGGRKTRLVLATHDPEIVALVREMSAINEGDKTAAFGFIAKNAARMVRTKDIEGMVEAGIDKNDKLHRRLKELNEDLESEFVVIDEGRRPGFLKSSLMLGGGVLVALFVAVAGRGQSAPGGDAKAA